jgi:glycerol-3-phosphate dehydrogenase
MNSFSSKNRTYLIEQISKTSFDLLVIGGGITGAGIALDATARGLKVALIEMQDFAAGTSGRSTKLIHGGLRYLKQLEFKLVAEVGKERKIVHKIAPHLARPERMLLPIVKNGSLGKFSARAAIFIYEWIARVRKEERHRVLTKEETIRAEPGLKKDGLLGGILFYEYRTDDARLTIEVMKEAVGRGAIAMNYMEAVSFIYKNGRVAGAISRDKINGGQYAIDAKYVINAGGPWVDAIDDLDEKRNKHKLHITKGVHLVFDWKKLPVKQSAYFDTYDGRMIFVIPREGKTYAGTTDTFYTGNMIHPDIINEDRDYILKCVNDYFPGINLAPSDIESGWAGLRPLVNKPGKGPSEISRKDEMFRSASGLITIAGGKLTGYRKMAQRVVNLVAENIRADEGKIIPDCETQNIQLSGNKMKSDIDFSEYMKCKVPEGIALGLTAEQAAALVYRYGTNTDEIYRIFTEQAKNKSSELPAILLAQLVYCIEKEMCVTPSDFFIRRTGNLYFDTDLVKRWKQALVLQMQKIMEWNSELTARFSNELQEALDELERMKN